MANDCLVKRLKGVVNNDNLVRLGSIRIGVDTTALVSQDASYRKIISRVNEGGSCIIRVIGTGTFNVLSEAGSDYTYQNVTNATINYGQSGHPNGWFTIEVNSGTYVLEIGSKYSNIIQFTCDYVNFCSAFSTDSLSEFDYIKDNLNYRANTISGVYAPLPTMTRINIGSPNGTYGTTPGCSIDASALSECDGLVSLYIKGITDQEMNIVSVLGNKTALTSLNCGICGHVTGDILELAAAQVAAGRTTGSIHIEAGESGVTIDGQDYHEYIVAHGGTWFVQINFSAGATGGYTLTFPQQ